MATGVNVKMGVEGVSQFKQGIKDAQNSIKTLDQALALNEKQFKATGDSEEYMSQKTELLKVKLEEQKSVIANAEQALKQMEANGVDKASKAFQTMQQQLLKAKGDLLDTEAALNGIDETAENAGNEVDGMNQQLKRIGDGVNYQNVTNGLDSITKGIEGVIKKAWSMGEAIVKATLGAGSWADELKTTAAQYEITPEQLQRMRKTANLIDTDVDTILTAQDKLKKNREEANKNAMGALAYLGIDPNGKSNTDVFWEAGEAIAALGKEEDKVHYAQALFGKSWRELVPLFQAGREEYDKTMESWSVVEDDQLDALGKMDDAYQKMQSEWETFKMELLSAFAGPLEEGMTAITGLFQELNKYLDTPEGQAMLKQMGDTVSGLITDLTNIDPAEVVGGLQSVINGITDALKWIDENHEGVVIAMEAILAGWATLKLAGGALKVMELINGIRGLTASSAASAGAAAGSSWGAAFGSAVMKASPFLAFLYTLLNPASSAGDDLDLIWDENGNPTTAGRDAGITWRQEEDAAHAGGKKTETLITAGGPVEVDEGYFDAVEDLAEKTEELKQTYIETTGGDPVYKDHRSNGQNQLQALHEETEQLDATEAAIEDLSQKTEELKQAYVETTSDDRIYKDRRPNGKNSLDAVHESLDQMNEAAEDMTKTSSELNKNMVKPADIATLTSLPETVASAVQKVVANIKIYMDGNQVGASAASGVNAAMGTILAQYRK